MARIPFLDVGQTYFELRADLDEAISRVLNQGWYVGGAEVAAFEHEFAGYVGSRVCVGTANGLDAIHLALRALGIGPGDEVIVPSNTYIASWLAVSHTGARPVPVEPDPRTFNINPDLVEAAVTARTRAIVPVHLYGQPADMDRLLEIAKLLGLRIVEDAAQAHGALYKGQRIGAHGDIVAWSFYPSKNLGAFGDGGAVTTNDLDLARRVHILSNYGSSSKYVNLVRGFNSRLDPIQAAVLRTKLRHLDSWNAKRAELAGLYSETLRDTPVQLPSAPDWAGPVWHLYVIRTPDRDELATYLASNDVETVVHYPIPPHLQAAYKDLGYSRGSFPISELMHEEVLSLPIGPHVNREQVHAVVTLIKRFYS